MTSRAKPQESTISLRILMVSPEQVGVLQTGGLAHATTGLATALNARGLYTEILMPYFLDNDLRQTSDDGESIQVPLDWRRGVPRRNTEFRVLRSMDPHIPTTLLRHENPDHNYFDNRNPGGPRIYGQDAILGEGFGAFGKAAAEYILQNNFDIVILNDWTTGLIAYHLNEAKKAGLRVPKVIFAIHNIIFQGLYPPELPAYLGLRAEDFKVRTGFKSWGRMSFIKAGLQYSDLIYTVSEQYAREIATPRFGAGLHGLMQQKRDAGQLVGILNGILEHQWDPNMKTPDLHWTFSAEDLSGKAQGKSELQSALGLPRQAEIPVFVLTSRLAEQKGFEYLIDEMDATLARKSSQWVVIGDGDPRYAARLRELEERFPEHFRYRPFSPGLERQMIRYGDFFVNAAWFEPSGLNQFFALKNGTIPVVSRAGGLADSVRHGENGLSFQVAPGVGKFNNYNIPKTRAALARVIEQALELYQNKSALLEMQKKGMAERHSWSSRIESQFDLLFSKLVGPPRGLKCAGVHGPG